MNRNRKGWFNDPYKHGLASKGIKTTSKGRMTPSKKNWMEDEHDISWEEVKDKFYKWIDDPDNLLDLAESLNTSLHKRIRYWPDDDYFQISLTASGNWEDQPETREQYIELYRSDHHWDYSYEETISNLDYILNFERDDLKDKYGDYFIEEFDEYKDLIEKANPFIRNEGWKEAYEKLKEDDEFFDKLNEYDVQAHFVVTRDLGELRNELTPMIGEG